MLADSAEVVITAAEYDALMDVLRAANMLGETWPAGTNVLRAALRRFEALQVEAA